MFTGLVFLLTPSPALGQHALPSQISRTPDIPLCRPDSLRCGLHHPPHAGRVQQSSHSSLPTGKLRGGLRSHPRAGRALLPFCRKASVFPCLLELGAILRPVFRPVAAQTCVAVADALNLMRTARASSKMLGRLPSSSPALLLPDCGADSRGEDRRSRPADLSLAYTCGNCIPLPRAAPRAHIAHARRTSWRCAYVAAVRCCYFRDVARRTPPTFRDRVHSGASSVTRDYLPKVACWDSALVPVWGNLRKPRFVGSGWAPEPRAVRMRPLAGPPCPEPGEVGGSG